MKISKVNIILATCISFVSIYGFAQKTRPLIVETGFVIRKETTTPIDGATIIFYPGEQAAMTDEQGKFSAAGSRQHIDSLLISAIGYERIKISYADFIKQDRILQLTEQVIELNAVTVTLNSGEQNKLISQVDMRTRNITNSQEVLRLVPGLFIGQHAGGGKAEQIFLRGFDIDHGTDVNITVDGMPVNMVSHAHGQGYADLHFLIPELIENVSFNKGPYHAEKGNMATAGHVDFRTKNVLSSNMLKLEAGQFNTYRVVGMMKLLSERMKRKEQQAFIAGEYMYTHGYFDNPQDFHRLNLFGKYRAKINDKNELRLTASVFSSKWNASGQVPERAVQSGLIGFFGAIDPNEGGSTGRLNFNTQLQTYMSNGALWKNQFYYSNYDFDLYSNFTFFLKNALDGDQVRQKEKRNLFGYNGSYSHTGYAADKKITSEAGISFRFDKTRDSELSRTRDRITLIEPVQAGNITELNTGAWLNETIQWNERFSINAGIRWDLFIVGYKDKLNNKWSKAKAATISPKLNFYYQLSDQAKLYLAAGKGFHSNDTRVVVQTGGREILPAAYGADLGIVLKPIPDLLLQAAAWYLKLDQEFIYVGDEGIVEPSGKSRRTGMDLSARYQPIKWLFIDADLSYSNGRAVEERKGLDHLPLAPVVSSTGGVTYKNSKGLHASLRYRYMGDRPANEDYSVVAKGYFVMDAMMRYERKRFELGLSVQNLLDVRWKETQFDTESKLENETMPVSEIHFTPGTPLFFKTHVTFFFN